MGHSKYSLMGKQLLLSVGLLPLSRWPAQNKPSSIFGGMLFYNVLSGNYFSYLFSFYKIIDPLHIYCGFQLSAFIELLFLQMHASLCQHEFQVLFVGAGIFFFCLLNLFYSDLILLLLLSWFLRYLLFKTETEEVWVWMRGVVREMWKKQE